MLRLSKISTHFKLPSSAHSLRILNPTLSAICVKLISFESCEILHS